MNEAVKFTGTSAALMGIAAFVPEGFSAFGFTGHEYQVILVAVAVINAIFMQFKNHTT